MKKSLKTPKPFVLHAALSITLVILLNACGGNASSGTVASFEAPPILEVVDSDSELGEVASENSDQNVYVEKVDLNDDPVNDVISFILQI